MTNGKIIKTIGIAVTVIGFPYLSWTYNAPDEIPFYLLIHT